LKTLIETLLRRALDALPESLLSAGERSVAIEVERTKDAQHGDFATNLAMRLGKATRQNPRKLAEALAAALPQDPSVAKVEIAGAGFINFFLKDNAYHAEIGRVLAQGDAYGTSAKGAGRRVVVEFVSANPTGPLHVGHGRQAALGDALASLLQATGYQVTREYYYNDAGVQIQNLALSVQARARGLRPGDPGWPENGYAGEYVQDVARDLAASGGNIDDLDTVRAFAVAYLRGEQNRDLEEFGLQFDVYYLESSLYADGSLDATVKGLLTSGKTYESDGALWLRTTEYGDDKDRVIRKSDGSFTYFVPDVAYHVNKWRRGFRQAINVHGADHHGTVARVRAGLQALDLGIPPGYPEYELHQMVRVTRGGEEVKLSKRAGSYVTLRDLIDWVGRDAVRFFLVSRKADAEFVFDVDLARARTEENPVYYVQYAHARVSSVRRQMEERGIAHDPARGPAALGALVEPQEQRLIKRICAFPETIEHAAVNRAPHTLVGYLRDLANDFHTYYSAHQFLVDDAALRDARVSLAFAAQVVIRNGLHLLGVSAPDTM
jgi:arginyl-tRNA synthetase